MDLSYTMKGRICVVYLDPKITDFADVGESVLIETQKLLEGFAKDESIDGILVSFQRVTKLASAGLGLMAATSKQLEDRGARFAICNLAPRHWRLFQITRLDEFLKMYPSEAAALAAMQSGGKTEGDEPKNP